MDAKIQGRASEVMDIPESPGMPGQTQFREAEFQLTLQLRIASSSACGLSSLPKASPSKFVWLNLIQILLGGGGRGMGLADPRSRLLRSLPMTCKTQLSNSLAPRRLAGVGLCDLFGHCRGLLLLQMRRLTPEP